MTATAQQLPAGFEAAKETSGLVFQNPSNWSKAELTGRMVQGTYVA